MLIRTNTTVRSLHDYEGTCNKPTTELHVIIAKRTEKDPESVDQMACVQPATSPARPQLEVPKRQKCAEIYCATLHRPVPSPLLMLVLGLAPDPGPNYMLLLDITIQKHRPGGILCKLVCAICVPYNPSLPRFRPCWAVVIC